MAIILQMSIDGDEFEPSDLTLDSYRDPFKKRDLLGIDIRDMNGNFNDAMLSIDEVRTLRDELTRWLETARRP